MIRGWLWGWMTLRWCVLLLFCDLTSSSWSVIFRFYKLLISLTNVGSFTYMWLSTNSLTWTFTIQILKSISWIRPLKVQQSLQTVGYLYNLTSCYWQFNSNTTKLGLLWIAWYYMGVQGLALIYKMGEMQGWTGISHTNIVGNNSLN